MGSPVSAIIADLYMEAIEKQAIATTSIKPRIWRRYVDDTFTIIKHNDVDYLLDHFNQQHPSIRFTTETENDNKIAFLDSLVTREPDGRLHTTVYRKPMHTNQYLVYDSNHPQSVKRGIVKCLNDRAKRIITKPSGTAQEKKHLSTVLVANCYPRSFLQKVTKTKNAALRKANMTDFKCTTVLPYIKGVSETLSRSLQQGIRTVFKSDTTLRSRLVRPKDPADPSKQDGIVYKIPCECGKVCIGETGQPMPERIKEHDRDICLALTQNSAISEHANETGHKPLWNEVKFIDRDNHWYTRKVKEAIHIRLHPSNINRDKTELKFQKRECQRSRNTTTQHNNNTRLASGPLRKTQQAGTIVGLKCTNQSRPRSYIMVSQNQSTPSPEED